MKIAASAVQKGALNKEELTEFLRTTKEACFFFDDEMQKHCDEMYKEGIALLVGHEMMEKFPNRPDYAKSVEAWGERVKRFNNQLEKLPKLFVPFLRIRE
jgi:hypothetical protein